MAISIQQPERSANRLASVRRLYLYLVAFVSGAAALVATTGLLETLARLWLATPSQAVYGTTAYSRGVASSAGLLLVATPIFLIHWGLAQGHRAEADERASLLRKLFLYGISVWTLASMLVNVYLLIEGLAQLAFGLPPAETNLLPSQWLAWTLLAMINGVLVVYWYGILQSDGDYGAEARGARVIRQLFLLLAGLAGLLVLLWGAASVLQVIMRQLVDASTAVAGWNWWTKALGSALAQLLVGGWLAYTNRAQWRSIVAEHPGEGQGAVRRFYLYAAVVIGAVTTLAPAALVLRELLLMVFGDSVGDAAAMLNKLVDPLSFVPVGLAIWLWHWRVLNREADTYGESREGAIVRRIYYYLMTATGLALTWVGAVELLHAVLDVLLNADSTFGAIWHEPLANGLSLLVIGAPIWALHWRAVQHIARQDSPAGESERGSLPRKIYLYGVALVGALVILFQLAQVVYRLLLLTMGDASAALFSVETAHQLSDCLVAGMLWGVHLWAIRGDTQMDKDKAVVATITTAAAETQTPEQHRIWLQSHISELEQQLAAAQSELDAINQQSTTGATK